MSFSKESMEPSGPTSLLDIPFKKRKDSRFCDESEENLFRVKRRRDSNGADLNTDIAKVGGTMQSGAGRMVDLPSEDDTVVGDEECRPFLIRDGISQKVKKYTESVPGSSSQTTVTKPMPRPYSSDSWGPLGSYDPTDFHHRGRSFGDRVAGSSTRVNSGSLPPTGASTSYADYAHSDDENSLAPTKFLAKVEAMLGRPEVTSVLPKANPPRERTFGDKYLNMTTQIKYMNPSYQNKYVNPSSQYKHLNLSQQSTHDSYERNRRIFGGESYPPKSEFTQDKVASHPSSTRSSHSFDTEVSPGSSSTVLENSWRENVPSKYFLRGSDYFVLKTLLAKEKESRKPPNVLPEVREILNLQEIISQERMKFGPRWPPRVASANDRMENTRKWVLSTQGSINDPALNTTIKYEGPFAEARRKCSLPNENRKYIPHPRLNADDDDDDDDDEDDDDTDIDADDVAYIPSYVENRDDVVTEHGPRHEMLNSFPPLQESNLTATMRRAPQVPHIGFQLPGCSRSAVPNIISPHYGSIAGMRCQLEPEQMGRTPDLFPPVPFNPPPPPPPFGMLHPFSKIPPPPMYCQPPSIQELTNRYPYLNENGERQSNSEDEKRRVTVALFDALMPTMKLKTVTGGTFSAARSAELSKHSSERSSQNAASGLSLVEKEKNGKNEAVEASVSNEDEQAQPGRPECAICLEAIGSKRGISSTVCGHVYCTKCINEVLEKKNECPTCRKPLNASEVHPLFLFT